MRNVRAGVVLAMLLIPAAGSAQDRAEVRVDARVTVPEFLFLDVVEHEAVDAASGRVELNVSANRSWVVTVKPKGDAVDYQVVSDKAGRSAEGRAGSNQRVVVEYRYRGAAPERRTTPPLEYVIAAR